jgi:hypothetical protein
MLLGIYTCCVGNYINVHSLSGGAKRWVEWVLGGFGVEGGRISFAWFFYGFFVWAFEGLFVGLWVLVGLEVGSLPAVVGRFVPAEVVFGERLLVVEGIPVVGFLGLACFQGTFSQAPLFL